MNGPNYRMIYLDLIHQEHPDKLIVCQEILKKDTFTMRDILELNKRIFADTYKDTEKLSHRYRAYSKVDILLILNYQKKHGMNNRQLAEHFKMSRNTISKWKKLNK